MFTPSSATASSWSGFSSLGKVIQGFGQYQSGQQAQGAYNYNAALQYQNAQVVRQSADLTEYQQKKNLESIVGRQQAQYAASGVSVTSGSPMDVMVETLSKGYLDIAISRYNSEIAARGYESQAEMDRYYGKQAAREGSMRAGLSLLESAADYKQPRKKDELSGQKD
jgi:hypothetical protein